jgi:two-component system OmpR family sensor kinase
VSLQRRLVAVMALLLITGLLVTDVVTYVSVRSFLYGRADSTLASSESLAFDYMTFAADHHETVTASAISRHVSPDVYLVILDRAGRPVLRRPSGSPTRPDPAPILSRALPVQRVLDTDRTHFGRYAGTFRPDPNAVVVGSRGDPGGLYRVVAVTVPQGTLVTALSLNPTNDTLDSLRNIELAASLAVLLIMGTAAMWVVRRGLRPLRDMAGTADAIAGGDLARRVPEERSGTEVGRLGVALNKMLTEIEGAFAEKSASEERLRQFVSDASHELRTPLTSIRGYAELLRRGGFSDLDGQRRALVRIEEEATRMGGLVEDLLLLAELDRGRPLRAEPVDLHRICAHAVDDSNAFEHQHRLALQPGPPVMVLGDDERLTQVAHNLVRNALAHTPAGTTVTAVTGTDGAMGFVRVTDNGPGIDPLKQARVFDRFYQGDPSRSGGGTGLGLAIVRAIAVALGGSTEIATPAGGGASLTVKIPLAPAGARAPASTPTPGAASSPVPARGAAPAPGAAPARSPQVR